MALMMNGRLIKIEVSTTQLMIVLDKKEGGAFPPLFFEENKIIISHSIESVYLYNLSQRIEGFLEIEP